MRAFKYIKDPEAMAVIADETRRRTVYLLRAREMTVSQIAEQLHKTPQNIYHHIRKLLDVGMAEVAREERVGHFIETYYRATAEVFEFTHGQSSGKELEEEYDEVLGALRRLGFDMKPSGDSTEKLAKLVTRKADLGSHPAIEEKIAQLDDVGFLTKQEVYKVAQLLTMSDKEFEEMLSIEREHRKLLKSMLKPARAGRNTETASPHAHEPPPAAGT